MPRSPAGSPRRRSTARPRPKPRRSSGASRSSPTTPRTRRPSSRSIDEKLATLEIDADEWEVLYRIRLQVERDLLTGRPVGTAPGSAGDSGAGTVPRTGPLTEPAAGFGIAAMVGVLLLLDIVVTVRDRFSGRT